jgi:nucleotide-binding universal stress UspA family protein
LVSDIQAELIRIAGDEEEAELRASIVVGHDRMPESRNALVVAIGFASRLSAHVHVVHAADLRDYPIDPDAADWEERAADALVEERKVATELLRSHLWGWTYLAGRGSPAQLLMSVANEHDSLMIVLGSRGEGLHVLLERLISPAVTHRLIERSRCPVLVVGPATNLLR